MAEVGLDKRVRQEDTNRDKTRGRKGHSCPKTHTRTEGGKLGHSCLPFSKAGLRYIYD
jgi:hypothetical protein